MLLEFEYVVSLCCWILKRSRKEVSGGARAEETQRQTEKRQTDTDTKRGREGVKERNGSINVTRK